MSTQPQEIGVAVAAYGSASRVFHVPLLQTIPGLVLRAVVSLRPDAVSAALPQVKVLPDFAALCADPDVELVVIPTPNDTHAPLAAQALAAGKHVVVDKPFTLTVRVSWSAIPGRPDPHSDRPARVADAAGHLGAV